MEDVPLDTSVLLLLNFRDCSSSSATGEGGMRDPCTGDVLTPVLTKKQVGGWGCVCDCVCIWLYMSVWGG